MRHHSSRLLLSTVCCLLAAEGGGGGGGSDKPPSLDAQLTASQARVAELEALQTAWGTERTQLTGTRDTLQTQVTNLTGQVNTLTAERNTAQTNATTLQGQLTTATGTITTLTAERDAAVALRLNPSAQAAAILAQAGGAPVPVKVEGNLNPAGGQAVASTGKRGLAAAMEKNIAKAAQGKA